MPLESLLVCRDPESLRVMRKVLDDVGIQVEVCTGPQAARELLDRHKFDAVLVDCDDMHDACNVLKDVRSNATNRNCIAFAITNGITSVTQAFQLGANFVLEKPLVVDRAGRVLRTARGLIESERRRYFRVPVEMLVLLRTDDGPEQAATSTNISSGGMALRINRPVADNATLHLQFTLPGTKKQIDARGEVAWADPTGLVGVRFRHIPLKPKGTLLAWLEDKVSESDGVATPPAPPRK